MATLLVRLFRNPIVQVVVGATLLTASVVTASGFTLMRSSAVQHALVVLAPGLGVTHPLGRLAAGAAPPQASGAKPLAVSSPLRKLD